MDKANVRRLFFSYLWITLASAVYALGFDWCYVPNQIGFGGITGVGQIINPLSAHCPHRRGRHCAQRPPLPAGPGGLLGGAPALLVPVRHVYLLQSSAAFFAALIPFQSMDPMLATIFGGLLIGLSLGVVLLQGATTGGTDLLARLLKLKISWLPMGKLLMAVDLVVIAAVALTFQNFSSALYGVVSLYIASVSMDMVLYGMDQAKVAYIISSHPKEVSQAILGELDRGVTVLHGMGAWSGEEKKVLLCAFKQRQIVPLKRIIRAIDPEAFLIVCNAHEVLGDGFRSYQQNEL